MIPFADVLIALKWLGALYACSVLGTLIFMRQGSQYPILRYSLGKAAGVIGLGAITWLLSLAKIVPFTAGWAWVITILFYGLVLALRHRLIKKNIIKYWRNYLFIEVIFVLLFIIGISLRASIPKIEGIEKFMDSAILSNLMRHTTGIPVDTWYAPDNLNYYYFGHWIIAMIAKLSHTSLAYAFNLGFATVLAVSGTSIFCLAWQITKRRAAGLLALFLALFASNLHPFLMILGGQHNYFFFNSGRFIDQVINEYPLYSIILGDLHAHYMALMLSTGFYLVIALIYLEKNVKYSQVILAAIAGGLAGLLSATNSFDVINCGLIFGLTVGLMRYRKKLDNIRVVRLIVAFGLAFSLLALVFMTHFVPAVGGVAIALFKTPLKHVFWQFGLPIILSVAALAVLYKKKQIKKFKQLDLIYIFGLAGLILILLPQILYLKDIYHFQNPPFARANTVFKIWYAAWPLVAITAASLIVFAYAALKIAGQRVAFVFVVGAGCAMLLFGTHAGLKSMNDMAPNTLNGLQYLEKNQPAKLDIINWVNKNISDQPVVLQAYGDSYSDKSWFASYSGLPTIIGWQSHEWGWRYNTDAWDKITARTAKLQSIYESSSQEDLKQKAIALGASYILIGPDELAVYKIKTDVFTGAFGQPVFGNAQYALYKVRY